MSESSVAVTIHDRKFTFALGPDQTADQVRRTAELIDERMSQAREAQSGQAPLQTLDLSAKVLLQTAVLASLNLVDELMKLQAEYEAAESQIEQRTSRLSASINRVFEAIETVDPKGS